MRLLIARLPIVSLLLAFGLGLSATPASGGRLITEYPVPSPRSNPYGIAVGPDGNLWFTEFTADKVGPDSRIWITQYEAGKIGPLRPPAATGQGHRISRRTSS